MPIVIQHQPPMTLVGQAAYQSALQQAYVNQRNRAIQQALDAQRLREAQREFNLQLADRIRARGFAAQQEAQQRRFEAARTRFLSEEAMRRQLESEKAIAGRSREQLQAQQDIARMRETGELGRLRMAHEWETAARQEEMGRLDERQAAEMQATLSTTLGQVAAITSGISPFDTVLNTYDNARRETAQLNAQLRDRIITPRDYVARARDILASLQAEDWQSHVQKRQPTVDIGVQKFAVDENGVPTKPIGIADNVTAEDIQKEFARRRVDYNGHGFIYNPDDGTFAPDRNVQKPPAVSLRDYLDAMAQEREAARLDLYPNGVPPDVDQAKAEAQIEARAAARVVAAIHAITSLSAGEAPPATPPPAGMETGQGAPPPPGGAAQGSPLDGLSAGELQLPNVDPAKPQGGLDNPYLAANIQEANLKAASLPPGSVIYVVSEGRFFMRNGNPVAGGQPGNGRATPPAVPPELQPPPRPTAGEGGQWRSPTAWLPPY